MIILTLDTETTGLPGVSRGVPPRKEDLDKWPHIVQMSWLMYDVQKGKIISEYDYMVQLPDGEKMPEESTAIHGITQRMSKNGICLKDALGILRVCVEQAQIVVGHNLDFDLDIIRSAALRTSKTYERDALFPAVKIYYCTMKHGRVLCNLVKPDGYLKSPRLEELHRHLFQENATNLHNSMIDVLVCFRCFYRMMYKADLCAAKGRKKLSKSRFR